MSKWSTWDPASALTGAEVIPLLQGGGNKRTTLDDVTEKLGETFVLQTTYDADMGDIAAALAAILG